MTWYLVNIGIIFLWALVLRPSSRPLTYWTALIIKLLAGLALGYIYLILLGYGDSLAFHQSASGLFELGQSSFPDYVSELFTPRYHQFKGEARNELFAKIISVFYLISGGSYWITSLYLSFISFLAAWYLVITIKSSHPALQVPAIVSFLFFPSVVFWSSGVLKDTLANAAIFFLAGICVRYYYDKKFRWWEYLATGISLLLLFYLKHYLAGMAFFIMALLVWFGKVVPLLRPKSLKIGATILTLVSLILLASHVNPRLRLDRLPKTIYTNYHTILENSDPGETIHFELEPSWENLPRQFPQSLIAGIARPFFWEVPAKYYPFALESLMATLLLCLNIYYYRSVKINLTGWLCLIYIAVLATLLPLVSPNIGSLFRYKVAYLPFLIFMLSVVPYRKLFTQQNSTSPQNKCEV